jgi:hypothetical protein
MVLTGGVHLAAREREEEGYWFGFFPGLARSAWAPDRPKWAGLFFFFVLILFLFSLFLYFFHNFCKYTSIQIKLLPEIFKRGAHYSKSVIKQVFKKKGYFQ